MIIIILKINFKEKHHTANLNNKPLSFHDTLKVKNDLEDCF